MDYIELSNILFRDVEPEYLAEGTKKCNIFASLKEKGEKLG